MTLRRALRVVGWNALLLLGGLILIVLGGEAYFRLTTPFMTVRDQFHFVPKVGRMRKPYTEVRYTNQFDFWTVSRANRLGFLDREPPSPARAAASCHLAMIGDSFVEARQVPIADKFHVRLEALAARDLPHLNVTTSAFGRHGTGQVQQLASYDAYARVLRPKLVVLVFVLNDFLNNSPILRTLGRDWDPDRLSEVSVARHPDGTLALRPPHPAPARLPGLPAPPQSWSVRAIEEASKLSWFVSWLAKKMDGHMKRWFSSRPASKQIFAQQVELLRQRPRYAALLEGRLPTTRNEMMQMFGQVDLLPLFKDALDYTAFALDQFKVRAARDGTRLVILASHDMKLKSWGPRLFDRLQGMAAGLGIPVIDQAAYILRQGATLRDAQWRHNAHWNIAGHRWAAGALLEWLRQHQEVCAGAATKGAP